MNIRKLSCAVLLLISISSTHLFAQIELKLKWMEENTWGVFARPQNSINPSPGTVTGSGQVTLVMPAGFLWNSPQSHAGLWTHNAGVVSPPENPTRRYVSFGLLQAEPLYPITYQTGEETLLFSFKGDGTCPDSLYIIDCNTPGMSDPYCPDFPDNTPGTNSQNSNPGNDISIIDFGNSSTAFYYFVDNYALSSWSCHDLDGDGIINILEDSNGNGHYDPGDPSDLNNACDPNPCDGFIQYNPGLTTGDEAFNPSFDKMFLRGNPAQDGFSLSPNPATDAVTFSLAGLTSDDRATIRIFSVQGNLVAEQHPGLDRTGQFSLQEIPSGLLVVMLEVNGEIVGRQKLVKQ